MGTTCSRSISVKAFKKVKMSLDQSETTPMLHNSGNVQQWSHSHLPSNIRSFIPAELLREEDPAFFYWLLHAYNVVFRFGYHVMFYSLLLFGFFLAPFLGMLGGLIEWACQIMRPLIRPTGQVFLDSLGVGDYVEAATIQKQREAVALAPRSFGSEFNEMRGCSSFVQV